MFKKNKNYCIYVGHHQKSRIRPDVLMQLKALSLKYSIIYITTSTQLIINDPLFGEVLKLVSQIIIRENKGYDFGSWKIGLDMLKNNFNKIESILLMNDSLYGPLFEMDNILDRTLSSNADITSMTASRQFRYHGQSYYISYNNKVINSKVFKSFWDNCQYNNIHSDEDKMKMVIKYEVDFYQSLLQMNFSNTVLFDTKDELNQSIYFWDKLIDLGMPFIKNTLIFNPQKKFNQMNINFSKINYYLKKNPLLLDEMKKFWIETSNNPTNIIY